QASSHSWTAVRQVDKQLQPKVRYRCAQLLSTLEAVSRGDGLSVVAQASLPEHADSRYVALPLAPRVPRRIGLAVLDRRQSSPAALAFIALAQGLYPSPT
ncbi:LysR family transcriptional regulator substrate-binding protein, partial [Pseudomonas lactis]|uniref:LysR family transcriptional regulator substrate-binding protein n=1 Tax=Pseudomonas lactis TaxID=1615674 RepID=UPI001231A6AC